MLRHTFNEFHDLYNALLSDSYDPVYLFDIRIQHLQNDIQIFFTL